MSMYKIDIALDMLYINSIDPGRYKATIAQDTGDKQSTKGFLKMV